MICYEITTATGKGRVPVTIFHINGNLDSNTYLTFQSKAEELMKSGVRYMLVDMTNVPFVSSAGLRALQTIFNLLRAKYEDGNDQELHKGISAGTYKSPSLKIYNITKEAETAFRTAGFDMFIDTFTDMESAISSF